MPIELLKSIASQPLPVTLVSASDIDKLRVLRAAGYVAAMLPAPGSDVHFARALAITKEGRAALRATASASSAQQTVETEAPASPRQAQAAAPNRSDSTVHAN